MTTTAIPPPTKARARLRAGPTNVPRIPAITDAGPSTKKAPYIRRVPRPTFLASLQPGPGSFLARSPPVIARMTAPTANPSARGPERRGLSVTRAIVACSIPPRPPWFTREGEPPPPLSSSPADSDGVTYRREWAPFSARRSSAGRLELADWDDEVMVCMAHPDGTIDSCLRPHRMSTVPWAGGERRTEVCLALDDPLLHPIGYSLDRLGEGLPNRDPSASRSRLPGDIDPDVGAIKGCVAEPRLARCPLQEGRVLPCELIRCARLVRDHDTDGVRPQRSIDVFHHKIDCRPNGGLVGHRPSIGTDSSARDPAIAVASPTAGTGWRWGRSSRHVGGALAPAALDSQEATSASRWDT